MNNIPFHVLGHHEFCKSEICSSNEVGEKNKLTKNQFHNIEIISECSKYVTDKIDHLHSTKSTNLAECFFTVKNKFD